MIVPLVKWRKNYEHGEVITVIITANDERTIIVNWESKRSSEAFVRTDLRESDRSSIFSAK